MADLIPIELARSQCRADSSDDVLLQQYTDAAIGWIEKRTMLLLSAASVSEVVDAWPRRPLALKRWPVTSIDSVAYLDSSGSAQSLDGSQWRAAVQERPARIAFTGSLPPLSVGGSAVTVTYTAGFSDPDDVPAQITQAALILLAEFYRNREAGAISDAALRSVMWNINDYRLRRV